MFSGYTVLSGNKKTELGSSNQDASQTAGNNARVVLVPRCVWKCVSAAISNDVDISEFHGCHLLQQTSYQ